MARSIGMARGSARKKHIIWKVLAVMGAMILVAAAGLALYVYATFETEVDLSLFGMQIADSTTRFY